MNLSDTQLILIGVLFAIVVITACLKLYKSSWVPMWVTDVLAWVFSIFTR